MFEAFNEAGKSIMNNQLYIIIIAVVLFLVGTIILFFLRQKPKKNINDDFENTIHEPTTQIENVMIDDMATEPLIINSSDREHLDKLVRNEQSVEQNRAATTYLFSLDAVCKTVIHRFYQVKLWSHNATHYDHVIDQVDQVSKNIETISNQFGNANFEDMKNN